MKIALLSEKYTPDIGGLAISAERLARLLASAGHAVRVFAPTMSLPPSEKRTLISGEVSVTRFGTTADTVKRARAWSANAGPDSSTASATTPIDRPMFPTA
jgi:glycogen synthase